MPRGGRQSEKAMNDWASPMLAQAADPTGALLGDWADSRLAVYCRDPGGRLLAANAAFIRRFGKPAEESGEWRFRN